MILNADLLDKGIKMMNEYLSEGVVTVNFIKQDGTDRKMRCTRRMDLIPLDKQPKPKPLPISDTMEVYKLVESTINDPQLFKVFDLDKQAWRSFRYTTIKSMSVCY
jgi:hypothetical protein